MKIFILAEQIGNEWHGFALAEDGTGLTGHISSSVRWLRSDMGIESQNKHDIYAGHYPDGYVLVDLIEATSDELDANSDYQRALRLNQDSSNA